MMVPSPQIAQPAVSKVQSSLQASTPPARPLDSQVWSPSASPSQLSPKAVWMTPSPQAPVAMQPVKSIVQSSLQARSPP